MTKRNRELSESRLLSEAFSYHRRGNHKRAEKLYKKILKTNPHNPIVLHSLGAVYFKVGEYIQARYYIQRALKINASDADSYNTLGLVHMALDNAKDACQAYIKALSLKEGFMHARYNLANAYKYLEKYDLAEQEYIKVIEYEPEYVDAMANLGNTYREMGKFDNAASWLKKAIDLAPARSDIYYNLGNVYFDIDHLVESIRCYLKAISYNDALWEAYINLGSVYERKGMLNEALSIYKKLVSMRVGYADYHILVGKMYNQLGETDFAIESYNRALKIDSGAVQAIYSLADIAERKNHTDKAESLLRDAKQIAPQNEYVIYVDAKLKQRCGEMAEAIRLYESVKDNSCDSKLVMEVNFRLGQCFDKICEYEKSFSCLRDANELARTDPIVAQFSKNKYLQEIESVYSCLDVIKSRKNQILSEKFGDELVFLIGFPRSGTTLLDVVLSGHPVISTVEEKPAVLAMQRKLHEMTGGRADAFESIGIEGFSVLRESYYHELKKHVDMKESGIIVDKLPLNLWKVHLIWQIFPQAKFLFAMRHPCDACVSCYMQNFIINDAMANFFTLEDTVSLYKSVMDKWISFTKYLPIDFYISKYESLVEDFPTSVNNIITFLGLDWDENLLNHQQTAKNKGIINTPSYQQVSRPVYQQSVYRWEKYKPFLGSVENDLQPYIHEFGYS